MDRLTQMAVSARDDPAGIPDFLADIQADVWRLASILVGYEHADDVAQDSLIRILHALPAFRGESTARTWVLRITRYTCADWLRARQRQRRLIGELTDLAPPRVSLPETGRVDLDLIVAELPNDFRDAFVLTQVLGLSYAEAADVCECQLGTIRSRVSRARAILVEAVRGDGVERDLGLG
jgi:RNA polymerase sigma-70 factor, ECF subfamily